MKTRAFRSLIIVAQFLVLSVNSDADELHVRQSGGAQYTRIVDALEQAFDGDVIIVGPGTYTNSLDIHKDIEIRGTGPQHVLLRTSRDGIHVGDRKQSISATISGISINSLEESGIVIEPFSSADLRNCVIADCAGYGVFLSASGNSQYDPSNSSLRLRNCTIARNRLLGVHFRVRYYGQFSIDDSIISENNETTGDSAQMYFSSDVDWNKLPVRYGHILSFGKTVATGNQTFSTGPLSHRQEDPRFVDAAKGNYMLRSTSRAINAGSTGLAAADPDGSPTDLGAYGGPGSAQFWPYPLNGPLVRAAVVEPPTVQQGGKIKIKATGTTR